MEPLQPGLPSLSVISREHHSVIVWQDSENKAWKSDIQTVEGSTQVVELAAVIRAFQLFQEPFNLITDSAYVANYS